MDAHDGTDGVVLVLEDEALIAISLQDDLCDAGYRIAGPFTTCAAALAWLDHARPDAAILDTELADGTCRDVARVLARRAVPFVIYSGHRQDRDLLAEFDTAVWIEKPVPSSDLIAACRQLIAATS
jgi:DNA-binding response OmpR family regulator